MTRTRTSLLAASMAAALALAAAPAADAEETPGTAASPAAASREMPAKEITSPAGEGAPAEKPFSKDDATNNGEPVAAGLVALPAVLTIGGTTYYLNKDGHTYVTDMGRIDAEPTTAEVDASKALLAQNSAEAARQAIAEAKAGERTAPAGTQAPTAEAQAPAPATTSAPATAATAPAPAPTTASAAAAQAPAPAEQRGMGAQTGSNTAARGLFALVLASVAGAALFAFARRSLI